MFYRVWFPALLLSALSACTTTRGNFRVLSDSKSQIPESVKIEKESRITGESCRNSYLIFGFGPPGKPAFASIEEALQDALKNEPQADSLVNARVDTYGMNTILYNIFCYRVEGTPARLSGRPVN